MRRYAGLGILLSIWAMLFLGGCTSGDSGSLSSGSVPSGGSGSGGGTTTGTTVASISLTGPTSLVASGASSNAALSAASLQITVTDTGGSLMANQPVSLVLSSGSLSTATTINTDGNGLATTVFTAPSTLGQVTIYAQSGGKQSNIQTVTITNGPPNTISAFPAQSKVGPDTDVNILVVVKDLRGNPVPNQSITAQLLAAADNESNTSSTFLFASGGGNPVTDSRGEVTVVYHSGTTAGTVLSPVVDTITFDSGVATVTIQKDITVEQSAVTVADLQFTSPSTTMTANGTSRAKLTVLAVDGSNKGVAGDTLSFATDNGQLDVDASVGGETTTLTGITTDSFGKSVIYLEAPSTVGTARVTVESASGYYKYIDFNFIAGSPDTVTVTAAPSTLGPTETSQLYIKVVDLTGNPVSNATLTLQLTTNATNAKLSGTTIVTNQFGEALASYTAGIKDGNDIITITSQNGRTATANLTVTENAVTVSRVTITSDKTTLTADGSSSAFVKVAVLDVNNKPAVGKVVSLTDNGGTFTSPTDDPLTPAIVEATTNVNGEALVTYVAGTVIGEFTQSADCDGVRNDLPMTLKAGLPSQLTVFFDPVTPNPAVPLSLISGRQVKMYAKILDAYNNVVSGDAVNFDFAAGQNNSEATLAATSSISDFSGVATTTYVAGKVSGVTDTVTVTVGGVSRNLQVAVQSLPVGTIDLAGPVSVMANGADSANPATAQGTIYVTVKDTAGNVLPGKVVAFASVGGGSFTPSNSVTTDSYGQAALTYTAPAGLGDVLISATVGLVRSTDLTIKVVNGPPKNIQVFPLDNQLGPGGQTEVVLLATDDLGYPVPGKTILANITTNASTVTVPYLGAVTTDSSGLARVTYTAGSGTGTDTITASSGAVSGTATISVTQSQTEITDFTMTTNRTDLVANGTDYAKLTVKVIDNQNRGVSGISLDFAIDNGLLDADVNVPGGTNTTQTLTTNANGEAVVYLIAPNSVGKGEVTVRAETGDFASQKFNFVPGVPATVTLSPTPNAVGPSGTSLLKATVVDATGNAVPNALLTFKISSNATGATLSSLTATTDLFGEAEVTYTAGAKSGTDSVTVLTDNNKSPLVAPTIAVAPGNVTVGSVSLSAVRTSLAADGGDTTTLTATVLDISGKPAVGKSVTFSVPTGTLSPDGDAVAAGVQGTTDINGKVNISYRAGIVAGITVASANCDGVIAKVNLQLKAGAPSTVAAVFNLTTNTITKNLNKGEATPVYVRVTDSSNNPVSGEMVTFTFLAGGNNSGAVLGAPSALTDASGIATVNYTAGTTAGTDTLTVSTTNNVTDTVTMTVAAAPVTVAAIEVGQSAIFIPVLNTASPAILVRTLDNRGQPVANAPISFTWTGSAAPGSFPATTDALGMATFKVSDGVAENATVTVTSGTVSSTVLVYSGGTVQLVRSALSAVADGSSQIKVTALFRDFRGNRMTNLAVAADSFVDNNSNGSFDAGDALSGARLTPVEATSDEQGQAVFAVTSTKAETVTLLIGGATTTVTFDPGPASRIDLSSSVATLSLNGSATIDATVYDVNGNPVEAGTVVSFTSSFGSINATVGTGMVAGKAVASATFRPGTRSGLATINASAGTGSDSLTINVSPSTAGTLEVASIDPADGTIHVLGTAGTQTARVTFTIKDGAGNLVADGASVTIAIPATSALNGGEALSVDGAAFAASVIGTTVNGQVAVTVRAGRNPGSLGILATVGTVSTMARVTIVGGQPDSRHISIAAQYLNMAGGVTFGLQDTITAFLGDRFGNVPLDGTPVSFYSECGTIGDSTGFTAQTIHGQAVTHHHTQNPTTPALDGVGGVGNDGLCTIMIATPGAEYFEDNNGNGTFDGGDTCSGDQGEPFIDGNDNGTYQVGEFYVDINKDGVYNGPDGSCTANTTIWTSMPIMMSDLAKAIVLRDLSTGLPASTFSIQVGGSQDFYFDLEDIYGNALVSGTTVKVSTDAGTLAGTTDFVMPDVASTGGQINFSLLSDIETTAKQKIAKITMSITPPASGGQGNNGAAQSLTIAGSINVPTAGSAAPTKSVTVTSGAAALVANNAANTMIRALVKDLNDNPAVGVNVTFVTNLGTIVAGPVVTDSYGIAEAQLTAGTVAGTATAAATSGGITGTVDVPFVAGPATSLTLTGKPTTLRPGTKSTLTATLSDANGNPVKDKTLAFSLPTDNTSALLSASSAKTDEQGMATVDYTAGYSLQGASEVDTVQARLAGGPSSNVNLTVDATAIVIKTVALTADKTTLIANNADTTAMYVTVTGDDGKPAPQVPVTLSSTGGSFVQAMPLTTDVNGQVTATFRAGTAAGEFDVTAVSRGVNGTIKATLTAGPPATVTLTPSPATVVPNGTSTLTARVLDANGNPVVKHTVTFVLQTDNTSASLASGSGETDTKGETTVKYTAGSSLSATSEIDTVRATSSNGINGNASITVSTGAMKVSKVALSSAAPSLIATGAATTSVWATVYDADSKPASGVEVRFSTTSGAITGLPVVTGLDGTATATLTSGTTAGAAVVTATAAGVAGTATVTYVAGVPTAPTVTISPSPVKPGDAATVTAMVLDANSNPVVGSTVNFAISTNNTQGSLAAASAVTNASGQATVSYTAGSALSATSEVDTVTATTSNALTGTATVTVSTSALVVKTVTIQTGAASLVANGAATTSVRATILDANGKPLPGVNVFFTTSSGSIVEAQPLLSDLNGVATATLQSGTATAAVTVTATSGGVAGTGALAYVAGPATQVILSPNPTTVAPRGASTLKATLLDANDNPVIGSTVTFDIPTNNSSASLSAPTAITGTDGVATITYSGGWLLIASSATDSVRATSASGVQATSPITVTSTGMVLDSITVIAANASLTADGADTTTLTAKVVDKDGNPAPGVSVTFAPLLGSVAPATVVSDGNGVATTTLTSGTTAGSETVVVAASGMSTSASLTYVPGAVATVTLTAAPTTVKPGGTTTLTATVKDGNGNSLVGQTVTFAASTNNSGGSFGAASVTNAAGETTVVYTAGLDLQAASEIDGLTATAGTITSAVRNITVDNSAIVVGSVTLQADDNSLTANLADSTVVTATVKQLNGSAAAGIQVFFTVNDSTLGTVTPGATDIPAYVITDSNGIAQAVFKSKAIAGNAVVTATAKGIAKTANITLIAGTPTKAVVAAAPSAVRPGGASTLTATVTDTNGNAVAGEVVTFQFSQNNSGAVMTTVTAVTGSDGVATVPYTAGNTAGGSDIVTVKVGSLLPAAITPVTISVSGSVNPVNSVVLTTGRGSLPADNTSTTTLRATVIGLDGDPVAGATVTFTTTMGTLSAASMTTDANGVAEVTLTAGTVSGSATVVANCSGFAGVQNITLQTQAPGSITVQASPPTVKPGGTSNIDVTVKDANGNPITGEVISFYFETGDNLTGGSIGGNNVGGGGAITNQAGVARFGYTGGIVNGTDTITVRAMSNGMTTTGTVSVDSSAKVINGIDLSVGDATPAIGGSTVVRAVVKDTSGAVLPGVTVNFSASRGTVTASNVTDQFGMAEGTLTIGALVAPGPLTLTATAGGFSDTLEIDVVAGAASAVTVTATPATVVPGSGSIIKATVKSGSNPVAGATVSFAVTTNASGGSLAAATAVTNIWGEATVNYTSGMVSAVNDIITATTTNNVSGTVTVTTSLAELKLKEIGVTAGSASIIANGSSTVIRAILTDINGNLAPSGVTVDFVTTSGTLSAASATTNSSGLAEVTLTSPTVIGTALVRASAKGYTASTTVNFVAGPVATLDLKVVNDPITVGSSSTIAVVAKDSNGNPVSGEALRFTINNNGDTGGSFSNALPVTGTDGRVEVTFDAEPSVAANTYTITATATNGISDNGSLVVNAAVVPGPTTQTLGSIALSAVTPTIRANGSSTTPLRASVTDTTGAAMSGVSVVFTSTLGSLVDSSGAAIGAPVTVTSNSSGDAEVYLKSGTVPGLAYVTAVTGGYAAESTVTFVAGPADSNPAKSSITANPSTILADGASTSEIVVTLADANNNPVANGTQVTLIATGGGTITSANPATTTSGRATFTLQAATSSGTGNLSIAEVSGVTGTITYGLSAASSGEPANILISTTQSNIAVAGVGKQDSTTISIQIVDSLGQPINETIWGANNTAKVEILAAPKGGESVSGLDAADATVSATVGAPIDIVTSGGSTTLNLQAGTLPGVVEIRVTAYDSTGTIMPTVSAAVPIVTITSGPAHTIVLSHPILNSIQDLNTATPAAPGFYRRVGTAVVTDRYGNSVADGTVINFGLIDSVIAEGSDGATTANDPTLTSAAPKLADGTGTTLSGASITRNSVTRKIQVNDRVLIVDARAEDKSRHVGSPLTIANTTVDGQRDFQNTAVGLDYVIGASLLGGYISGVATDGTTLITGQGVTVNGLAKFYVTYPANTDGIMTGCAPYRDTRTVPMGGARVYVSASASDDSATTVNLGQFCFSPIAGFTISTSSSALSDTSQVTIQVRDGGDTVPVPFVGVSAPVAITNRGTYDACTDGTSPTQAVCEEQNGTCTGAAGATKAICEAAGGTWTPTETWVTYTSNFDVASYVNLMSADAVTDLDGDGFNDAAYPSVSATACVPNADLDGDGKDDINPAYLVSVGNIGGGGCAEYVYPYTVEGGTATVSVIVTGNNRVKGDTATVGVVSGDGSTAMTVTVP